MLITRRRDPAVICFIFASLDETKRFRAAKGFASRKDSAEIRAMLCIALSASSWPRIRRIRVLAPAGRDGAWCLTFVFFVSGEMCSLQSFLVEII